MKHVPGAALCRTDLDRKVGSVILHNWSTLKMRKLGLEGMWNCHDLVEKRLKEVKEKYPARFACLKKVDDLVLSDDVTLQVESEEELLEINKRIETALYIETLFGYDRCAPKDPQTGKTKRGDYLMSAVRHYYSEEKQGNKIIKKKTKLSDKLMQAVINNKKKTSAAHKLLHSDSRYYEILKDEYLESERVDELYYGVLKE